MTDFSLYTDASNTGRGTLLETHLASGIWDEQTKARHINWLELKAVFLALQEFEEIVTNHNVMVVSDNTTVVAYINNMGGTHSPTLCYLLWDMMLWCKEKGIVLRARHLPGRRNGIADALSRRMHFSPTEWEIPQEVTHTIFLHWGRPLVDLFATFENRKLPVFVAPTPDLRAMAVDALSFSWKGLIAYAFPPLPLLPLVLRKIQNEDCVIILIAPLWPRRSWFPLLLSLLVDRPVRLPERPDLLSQGRNLLHPDPTAFHLHAFKLSSRPSLQRAFLRDLPTLSPVHNELAPKLPIVTNGESSLVGVIENRSIHSISLHNN